MPKTTTGFLSKETTGADAARVAIATFAASATPARDDPRSSGATACDDKGDALSARAPSAVLTVTASSSDQILLPTLASRRWALIENQSDDTDIWWAFSSSAFVAGAGTAFRLGPGGRVFFPSGDLPNIPLRVRTASGTAVVVGQQC